MAVALALTIVAVAVSAIAVAVALALSVAIWLDLMLQKTAPLISIMMASTNEVILLVRTDLGTVFESFLGEEEAWG